MAINNLIPTGIMTHLIENFYTKKWKFKKSETEPKVLSLDDLLFGFNIWLGSCLVSFVAFVAEHGVGYIRRPKKVKFAKVRPIRQSCKFKELKNLSPDLINNFRVQKDTAACFQPFTYSIDDNNVLNLDSVELSGAQCEDKWFF